MSKEFQNENWGLLIVQKSGTLRRIGCPASNAALSLIILPLGSFNKTREGRPFDGPSPLLPLDIHSKHIKNKQAKKHFFVNVIRQLAQFEKNQVVGNSRPRSS